MANNNQQDRDNLNRDKSGTPGNFKNDPQRASEAGKKGGEASGGKR